jgi:hypothetical protein
MRRSRHGRGWRRPATPAIEPDGGPAAANPGYYRWADLLAPSEAHQVIDETTRPLPVLAPLLTRAAAWRSQRNTR